MVLRPGSQPARIALACGCGQRVSLRRAWFQRHTILTLFLIFRPAAIADPEAQVRGLIRIEVQLDAALQTLPFDSAPAFRRSGGKELIPNLICCVAHQSEVT